MSGPTRDPRDLTRDDAWRMLLPTDRSEGIVSTVVPWTYRTRPFPPNPLDGFISKLAKAGALRSEEDLAETGIACPFLHGREQLVAAVADSVGRVASLARARARGPERELAAQAEEMRDLADLIERMMPSARRIMMRPIPVRPTQRRDAADHGTRDLECLAAQVYAEQTAAHLRRAAARALEVKDAINPPNTDGDPWRQAFAERMAYCWTDLTGEDASEGKDNCRRFVEAAYMSLGGEEGIEPWVTPLRTARERVKGTRKAGKLIPGAPEWDRFDRRIRGSRPPGGEILPIEHLEDRHTKRRRLFVARVLDWVDARSPDAKARAWEALMGHYSYAPDSVEHREEVRLIVANRDAGGSDLWAGAKYRPHYGKLIR